MSAETSKKPRLGGRSARVREAVLTAAFAELGEKGYEDFNLEAVAPRSGVHKTTVYRRWPTREALVVDALDSRSDRYSPIAETGSIRDDLVAFGEDVLGKLSSPHGKAMLKSLVAAVDQSPEILAKVSIFWRERLDVGAALITRGIERGDLPPDTNIDLVVEGLLAPIYLRVLFGQPVTDRQYLEEFTDLILRGIAKGVGPGAAPQSRQASP
jgi:AcrR family transcriptional regulator